MGVDDDFVGLGTTSPDSCHLVADHGGATNPVVTVTAHTSCEPSLPSLLGYASSCDVAPRPDSRTTLARNVQIAPKVFRWVNVRSPKSEESPHLARVAGEDLFEALLGAKARHTSRSHHVSGLGEPLHVSRSPRVQHAHRPA